MRIGEYLQVGEKLKAARKNAKISQRKMASELGLSFSTYSNYENGYSEPPMEIINQACAILHISVESLFGMSLGETRPTVQTFADFFQILIDLDRRGVPIYPSKEYTTTGTHLTTKLTLEIHNAQLATLLPDWAEVNEKYKSGKMRQEEYDYWLRNVMSLFNVPIENYVYKN